MIYELRDIQKEQFWVGCIFGAVMTLLIVLSLDRMFSKNDPNNVQMPHDVITAYNMGIKDALKTNPVSADLEHACMELWANKQ